jgi:hypothetical protein
MDTRHRPPRSGYGITYTSRTAGRAGEVRDPAIVGRQLSWAGCAARQKDDRLALADERQHRERPSAGVALHEQERVVIRRPVERICHEGVRRELDGRLFHTRPARGLLIDAPPSVTSRAVMSLRPACRDSITACRNGRTWAWPSTRRCGTSRPRARGGAVFLLHGEVGESAARARVCCGGAKACLQGHRCSEHPRCAGRRGAKGLLRRWRLALVVCPSAIVPS